MTATARAFDGQTINTGLPVPEVFYVFVNQNHPVTWHNFQLTGRFASAAMTAASMDPQFLLRYLDGSADYTPFLPNPSACPAISAFGVSLTAPYAVEYDAESFRRRFSPLFPSRFSAVYAFGDMESCEKASAMYHWPLASVVPFKLADLPYTRVARVNMEHVSVARAAYSSSTVRDPDAIWRAYWEGAATVAHWLPAAGGGRVEHTTDELWEYLIDGILVRADR